MAQGDEVSSTSDLNSNFDIDELLESYNELMTEFKKLHKKRKETNLLNEKINKQLEELEKEKHKLVLDNQTLRNEKVSLNESLKDLVKKNKDLISKNKNFTKNLEKSKSLIDRFILSSTRLNMMLKSQRAIFDKAGLGYKSYYKQKSINTLYKKPSSENIICFCYGKLGHKSYTCNMRNRPNSSKIKQIWVVKNPISDKVERSKVTWVPKQA